MELRIKCQTTRAQHHMPANIKRDKTGNNKVEEIIKSKKY